MTVSSYHITYAFQSESTLYLYSCLHVKELLSRSRRKTWSLSDWNWTRIQNNLARERTLNHLAKCLSLVSLAKCLSVCLRTKWFWVWVPLQSLKLQIARYISLNNHVLGLISLNLISTMKRCPMLSSWDFYLKSY